MYQGGAAVIALCLLGIAVLYFFPAACSSCQISYVWAATQALEFQGKAHVGILSGGTSIASFLDTRSRSFGLHE